MSQLNIYHEPVYPALNIPIYLSLKKDTFRR